MMNTNILSHHNHMHNDDVIYTLKTLKDHVFVKYTMHVFTPSASTPTSSLSPLPMRVGLL